MDVMETLLPMLTNMPKITVWFQKPVSHSKLQFGPLVDNQDVITLEMELHLVYLLINVPVMLIITHKC